MGIVGNGKIVLAKGQTKTLFGYSREELIGRPIERGTHFDPTCTTLFVRSCPSSSQYARSSASDL